MTAPTRRGSPPAGRSSTSTDHGTRFAPDCTPTVNPEPAPPEPYGGPSQAHGTVGHVYAQRLAAKATTPTVDDIEATFHAIVDQLGDQRARVLLMRRCGR